MRLAGVALAALTALGPRIAPAQLTAQQKADIGFTSLQARLGPGMPTGTGISATVVEASFGPDYGPDALAPQLAGKTFVMLSGPTGASGHATAVSQYLLGSASLAPAVGDAVRGDSAAFFRALDWLQGGFLRPAADELPLVEARELVNLSWVATGTGDPGDVESLRRVDYAIGRDGFIATFALNNGSGTEIPLLMASAYNGIVVGLSDGNHSRGTTTVDGAGRSKPDLVVPTNATSWAAATVSSAAGVLVEAARAGPGLSAAERPQVVKSLLMAGAVKRGPTVPFTDWSNAPSHPLDAVYGAGQLDIENAYDILAAGEHDSGTTTVAVGSGWDFGTTTVAASHYVLELAAGGELTAALNWHRTVTPTLVDTGTSRAYEFPASLANLDLRLFTAAGFMPGSLVAASLGLADNTELIWATGLAPGRYVLEVSADMSDVDYGLAWFVVVPEPATGSLVATAAALAVAWRSVTVRPVRRTRRRRGSAGSSGP